MQYIKTASGLAKSSLFYGFLETDQEARFRWQRSWPVGFLKVSEGDEGAGITMGLPKE